MIQRSRGDALTRTFLPWSGARALAFVAPSRAFFARARAGALTHFAGTCARALTSIVAVAIASASPARAASIAELLPERLRSVVAIEFTIQTETDRRQATVAGTVVDADGTIIMPGSNIPAGLPVDQLREFKIYRPESDEPFTATYLGQDTLTGFHFVRVEERAREFLTPITAYPAAPRPARGEEVWGIGLRGKDEDFAAYVLSARIAMTARLPNRTALAAQDLASPGLPVFARDGKLAGLALNPFGQNFLLFSRTQAGTPIMLVNAEESSVVLLVEEFLPFLTRVPKTPTGRPASWIGVYGLEPVDPEVAKLLSLERQSGLVVSDILDGSPAARAGLRDRDILLAVDGEPLPRLKPDRVVVGYFGQEVLKRSPGDEMTLTVLRDSKQQELRVKIGDEPKMVREATRKYYERLGVTVRETVVADRLLHRANANDATGVIVHFTKPNSPVATAGLRPDDWIREVDGSVVNTFDDAAHALDAIEADKSRAEFVLLTRRGGETQVLRVKLN